MTYRVVSADSHPISGGFVFAVGEDAAPPARGVAELLGDQKAGPVTSVAFAAARAVQYGAIALGLGLLAVLLLAWRPALRATGAGEAAAGAFAARARRLLLAAGIAGAVSGVAAIGLQAATAQGDALWSSLGAAGDVLQTRFGTVWGDRRARLARRRGARRRAAAARRGRPAGRARAAARPRRPRGRAGPGRRAAPRQRAARARRERLDRRHRRARAGAARRDARGRRRGAHAAARGDDGPLLDASRWPASPRCSPAGSCRACSSSTRSPTSSTRPSAARSS